MRRTAVLLLLATITILVETHAGWDPAFLSGWRTVSGNSGCSVITASNPAGTIYAVGYASPDPVATIYKYSNGIWTPIPNAYINDGGAAIYAMVHHNGSLYVGGVFTSVGPGFLPVNNIARFNLASGQWYSVGTGVTHSTCCARVNTIAISPAYAQNFSWLYVGGMFDQAGNAPANNIARFRTDSVNTWDSLSGGVSTPNDMVWSFPVNTIHVQDYLQSGWYYDAVFVGGYFNKQIGQQTAYNLARWNDYDRYWTRFGAGFLQCYNPDSPETPLQNYRNFISQLTKKPNGEFIITGSFQTVDGNGFCGDDVPTDPNVNLASMPAPGGVSTILAHVEGPISGSVAATSSDYYLFSGSGKTLSDRLYYMGNQSINGFILRSLNGVWSALPPADPNCTDCEFNSAARTTNPSGVYFGGEVGAVRWIP